MDNLLEMFVLKVNNQFIARTHEGDFVKRKMINEDCLYASQKKAELDKSYMERTKKYKGEITLEPVEVRHS